MTDKTAPSRIPLNTIDRGYLIREAADSDVYFPMSIVTVVRLKDAPTPEHIADALMRLVEDVPQLRLGYRLDAERRAWVRVNRGDLRSYLRTCVQDVGHTAAADGYAASCGYAGSIEEIAGQAVSVNNADISQPVNVLLYGSYLLVRMHHSFGDGKFLFLLTHHLLMALAGSKSNAFPMAERWWMPLWRVIWQTPAQGFEILWRFVKASTGYYQDFQNDTQTTATEQARQPIRHGSPMRVKFCTLPPDTMQILNTMRGGISLNSLLQVLVEEQLHRMGLINRPTTYTVPVDLRRYLKNRDLFYAGNLASQVRIRLENSGGIDERAAALNAEVQQQLTEKMPLVSLPGEWLLALAGDKTYQAMNREWLLKSTHNDLRFFVLTNLGSIGPFFDPVHNLLDDSAVPHAVPHAVPCLLVPLMGGPPLVLSFCTYADSGHLAITYDPSILTESHISTLIDGLTGDSLYALADSAPDLAPRVAPRIAPRP